MASDAQRRGDRGGGVHVDTGAAGHIQRRRAEACSRTELETGIVAYAHLAAEAGVGAGEVEIADGDRVDPFELDRARARQLGCHRQGHVVDVGERTARVHRHLGQAQRRVAVRGGIVVDVIDELAGVHRQGAALKMIGVRRGRLEHQRGAAVLDKIEHGTGSVITAAERSGVGRMGGLRDRQRAGLVVGGVLVLDHVSVVSARVEQVTDRLARAVEGEFVEKTRRIRRTLEPQVHVGTELAVPQGLQSHEMVPGAVGTG